MTAKDRLRVLLRIEHFTHYTNEKGIRYSEWTMSCGFLWRVKSSIDSDGIFSVYLECKRDDDNSEWTAKIDCVFQLISHDGKHCCTPHHCVMTSKYASHLGFVYPSEYILNAEHGHISEDCVEVAVELDFNTFHLESK